MTETNSSTVNLIIDGVEVAAPADATVMEAAELVGVRIPRLCYHPYLSTPGACRVCVCEVEGMNGMVASCSFPVAEGMNVRTTSPHLRQTRRNIVELILDNHPEDCQTCERDGNCELQRQAYALGVRERLFAGEKKHYDEDCKSPAVMRDPNKCILCGRCVRVCGEVQGIHALTVAHRGFHSIVVPEFEKSLDDSVCSACGQCINVCPTAAFLENFDSREVWQKLSDPNVVKVAQFAPSVRAAIGEAFGLEAGLNMQGQTVTALRRLGFDYVFDTQFAADLTIMEEATELVERIKQHGDGPTGPGQPLPMLTSCSAAWMKYIEQFYPEFIPNLSSCKSPMSMLGTMINTHWADRLGKRAQDVYSVAAMCCTAKKYEADRPELRDENGLPYVDTVITTRELAWMIKSMGLDFPNLPESDFDHPLGESTGAGAIFGASGGVMEAAIRTAYHLLTGEHLGDLEVRATRGVDGPTKEASIEVNGLTINVAVAHGLGHAAELLEAVKRGDKNLHFIEIMGCPGGCIGGGGQPYAGEKAVPMDRELLAKRASALYSIDAAKEKRRSYENEDIKKLYDDFLGEPGGPKSHELLHTHYHPHEPRGVIAHRPIGEGHTCILPDDPRFVELDAFIETRKGRRHEESELIPVLHCAQNLFGHIPEEVVEFVATRMNIPRSKIFGVATFYHYFSLNQRGQFRISVCMGTACYVKGSGDLVKEFQRVLGIGFGDLTGDGLFSLECARCIGACGQAPVVMINDDVHTRVRVTDVQKIVNEYHEKAAEQNGHAEAAR